MMVCVILENLYHRDPRLALIVNLCLTAEGKNMIVLVHTVGHVRDRVSINSGIGIDCHHIPNLIQWKLHMLEGILDGSI